MSREADNNKKVFRKTSYVGPYGNDDTVNLVNTRIGPGGTKQNGMLLDNMSVQRIEARIGQARHKGENSLETIGSLTRQNRPLKRAASNFNLMPVS